MSKEKITSNVLNKELECKNYLPAPSNKLFIENRSTIPQGVIIAVSVATSVLTNILLMWLERML